jgi:hypothetical protein
MLVGEGQRMLVFRPHVIHKTRELLTLPIVRSFA